MNYKFPKLNDLPTSESKLIDVVPKPSPEYLKQVVLGFFEFYAKRYEINNHLISVNIGRWQQIRVKSYSTQVPTEIKRLYNYIIILTF